MAFFPKCAGCGEDVTWGRERCEFRARDGDTAQYHRECCPTCSTQLIVHEVETLPVETVTRG